MLGVEVGTVNYLFVVTLVTIDSLIHVNWLNSFAFTKRGANSQSNGGTVICQMHRTVLAMTSHTSSTVVTGGRQLPLHQQTVWSVAA